MRNKITFNRRNKLIYEAYCQRWGDGLRDEVIFPELHDLFHLQPKTLEDIVRMMRKKSQQSQPEIDFGLTPGPSPEGEGCEKGDVL